MQSVCALYKPKDFCISHISFSLVRPAVNKVKRQMGRCQLKMSGCISRSALQIAMTSSFVQPTRQVLNTALPNRLHRTFSLSFRATGACDSNRALFKSLKSRWMATFRQEIVGILCQDTLCVWKTIPEIFCVHTLLCMQYIPAYHIYQNLALLYLPKHRINPSVCHHGNEAPY